MTDKKLIAFGIDYLRIGFPLREYPPVFELLFAGLSSNSNWKKIPWDEKTMDVTFTSTENKHIITLRYADVPVICIEKIINGGAINKYSYFAVFYSAFFHFPELGEMLREFVQKFGDTATISRIDIYLDVAKSTAEVEKGIRTQFKKIVAYKNGGLLETLYLGAKGCTNKKHFIRIYDKLKDSQKKGKFELYGDYIANFEHVTRIEAQINSQSCQAFDITLWNINEVEKLQTIFASICINPSGTYIPAIDIHEFNNLELIRREPASKSLILEKLKYAKIMFGYARNLKEAGFDPIGYLKKHLVDKNLNQR